MVIVTRQELFLLNAWRASAGSRSIWSAQIDFFACLKNVYLHVILQDQILSPAELMDLYAFKFADKKPEIAYNAEPRTPRPDTFFVSFELLADIRTDTSILDEEEEEEDMNFGSRETFVTVQLGKVTVEVRADIVPATSKFFFRLCDDDLRFRIMYGDVEFERHGTTETKLGKLKVFPRENNLLRSVWQGPSFSGAGFHCCRPKVCAAFENGLAQIIRSRREAF